MALAVDWSWAALMLAAFAAGLVDAVAGGGGLIQVPALFTALPGEAPATIFGTNKASSVFGTANAAWRYAGRVAIPWRITLAMAGAAFAASFVGAAMVAWLPVVVVRPLILFLLVAVAVYTFLRPQFGALAAEGSPTAPTGSVAAAVAVGIVLGFYDGFFGPGMGSFVIFALVRWFGLDFLRATASAKVVNGSTNIAALAYFVPSGHVLWLLGLSMAVFNVLGAQVGTRLAIARGSAFVRVMFLVATVLLIAKFGHDTWLAMVK